MKTKVFVYLLASLLAFAPVNAFAKDPTTHGTHGKKDTGGCGCDTGGTSGSGPAIDTGSGTTTSGTSSTGGSTGTGSAIDSGGY